MYDQAITQHQYSGDYREMTWHSHLYRPDAAAVAATHAATDAAADAAADAATDAATGTVTTAATHPNKGAEDTPQDLGNDIEAPLGPGGVPSQTGGKSHSRV